jgi:hypothetical protein
MNTPRDPDADTQRAGDDDAKDLSRHKRLGSGTGSTRGDKLSAGWGLVLFGLIFVGVGVAIVLMSADVIPTDDSDIHVPRWVFGTVGGVFALPGLMIVLRGVRGGMRKARLKALARQHPDDPALGDYEWDRHASRDEGKRGILGSFVAGALILLFSLPFGYVGFFEDAGIPFAIGGIVVALVGGGVLAHGVYLFIRRLKYGGGRIEYSRFPFRTGEILEAHWIGDKPIHNYHRITFTLRSIEEEIEISGTGKNRSKRYVRYQRWADTFDVDGPGEYTGGTPISLTFSPPADAPSSALSLNPPRYWECEIHAETPGVDFRQTYLLPVYAPPST